MTGIVEACAFARAGEGLAGAGARPNRSGPARELEREIPAGDSGKEVAALESTYVFGLHVSDVALVDDSGGDEPSRDEFSEPGGGEAIVLVIVGLHVTRTVPRSRATRRDRERDPASAVHRRRSATFLPPERCRRSRRLRRTSGRADMLRHKRRRSSACPWHRASCASSRSAPRRAAAV